MDNFFIVGCPRSGTTFLTEVLNRHSKVYVQNEVRLLDYLSNMLREFRDTNYMGDNPDRKLFFDMLKKNLSSLVHEYYLMVINKKTTATIFGDKTPGYIDPLFSPGCIELIEDFFPDSKVIHIVRKPVDVISSIVKNGWATDVGAADMWGRSVQNGRKIGFALGKKRYLEVIYEDLVENGCEVVHGIISFLGLEWDDKIDEFLNNQSQKRTPFSNPTGNMFGNAATVTDTPLEHKFVTSLLGNHIDDIDRSVNYYQSIGATNLISSLNIFSNLDIRITDVSVKINNHTVSDDDLDGVKIVSGDIIKLTIGVLSFDEVSSMVIGTFFSNEDGEILFGQNNILSGMMISNVPKGLSKVEYTLRSSVNKKMKAMLTVGIGLGVDAEYNLKKCWYSKAITFNFENTKRLQDNIDTITLVDVKLLT